MDGVMYRGTAPLPGVSDLLNALAVRGRRCMLATNNSMATAAQYVAKLAGMGITVPEKSILTSALATRDYLVEAFPSGSGIFVIGAPALREVLFTGTTFQPIDAGEPAASVVVVGLDKEFNYAKLSAANAAIRAGATFIATNGDATLPTENGLAPGCGSILAAISTSTGVLPTVIGKPEPIMLEMALHRMGVKADETVMVGDRLDTDILAGRRAG